MDLEVIKNYLIEKTAAFIIILFGSAAAARLRDDSDIDVAFLSEKSLDEYEVFLLAQELAAKIGRDVDLIDLSKASTVFKANILGTGKIIYSADEQRKNEFQIRTFKEYALLNEERKEVLNKAQERGHVYEK
ncbi:MAG TPA: nucleotidyltransferase domain-containing protein [Peptococcaceae bacterium]|jgi:predicted nucleotidyltransferase|nr:nucleotidyltransferase domain-containing protein [Clostridia bacterium]HPZ71507.1 nucleotidyltransferase domain-containing protein [Peptococcaceae bacterium]HQD54453.1 nucleotidyltransferase domain-containing protein [Peptococcaceae bacterium]